MKLLLSSGGFWCEEIVAECERLVGKPRAEISFAVINEGYIASPGDHTYVIKDFWNIHQNWW